jgi:hypothetical protein
MLLSVCTEPLFLYRVYRTLQRKNKVNYENLENRISTVSSSGKHSRPLITTSMDNKTATPVPLFLASACATDALPIVDMYLVNGNEIDFDLPVSHILEYICVD